MTARLLLAEIFIFYLAKTGHLHLDSLDQAISRIISECLLCWVGVAPRPERVTLKLRDFDLGEAGVSRCPLFPRV